MSDFSNYAENAIANAVFRNITFTSPSVVYLGVGTAVSDPEAPTWTELGAGIGYARQAITFGAPSNGVITNTAAVTFGPATASWGSVTVSGIFDAVSGGNALSIVKAITTPRTVASGDSLQFAIGAISFTVA